MPAGTDRYDAEVRSHAGASTASARAEHVVQQLLASTAEFAEAVGTRPVEYHAIDDYGMGAIWLASQRNGEFTWTGPPYDD